MAIASNPDYGSSHWRTGQGYMGADPGGGNEALYDTLIKEREKRRMDAIANGDVSRIMDFQHHFDQEELEKRKAFGRVIDDLAKRREAVEGTQIDRKSHMDALRRQDAAAYQDRAKITDALMGAASTSPIAEAQAQMRREAMMRQLAASSSPQAAVASFDITPQLAGQAIDSAQAAAQERMAGEAMAARSASGMRGETAARAGSESKILADEVGWEGRKKQLANEYYKMQLRRKIQAADYEMKMRELAKGIKGGGINWGDIGLGVLSGGASALGYYAAQDSPAPAMPTTQQAMITGGTVGAGGGAGLASTAPGSAYGGLYSGVDTGVKNVLAKYGY